MENPMDLLGFEKTLKKADEAVINQFKNVLPDFLIEDWLNRGFASYMDGFLITTDPNDYYDIIKDWVDDPANCHVILRTAFGYFYYFNNGEYYQKSIITYSNSHLQDDFQLIIEFSLCNKNAQKNLLHRDIYTKAVKRLGPPEYDEVYAFVPAIQLGGNFSSKTVQKVKLKEHLAFLSQL